MRNNGASRGYSKKACKDETYCKKKIIKITRKNYPKIHKKAIYRKYLTYYYHLKTLCLYLMGNVSFPLFMDIVTLHRSIWRLFKLELRTLFEVFF